jgi:hypothetical protein
VENLVRVVRERFFTPRLRVTGYDELNAWLLDRCVAYAKVHKASRADQYNLAGIRGGAPPVGADPRRIRRLPRDTSRGLEG